MSKLSDKIRAGQFNPNMRELFFSKLIKALIQDLDQKIDMYFDYVPGHTDQKKERIPHIIYNTGDDRVWLEEQDYDYSKEPAENTNVQSVYSQVPRCSVRPSSMDIQPDQLSSPYSRGTAQITYDDELHTLSMECRRIPVTISIDLTYILNNYTEVLTIMQFICTKLSFIQVFKFSYLGQVISASYRTPDAIEDEHQTELDGTTQDERNHLVNTSIELSTNIPVYEPRTCVETNIITTAINTLSDHHEILDARKEHGEHRFPNVSNNS